MSPRLLLALSVVSLTLACAGGDERSSATTTGGGAGASGAAAGKAGQAGAAAGQGGAAAGQAGASAQGGGAGSAGAPAGAGGASGAGGAVTTTVRVHYPLSGGKKLTLRGDHGGLSWDVGKALASSDAETWVFSTTSIDAKTELKPLVDDATWSLGPNYVVSPGETKDVYPHFTVTKGKLVTFADPFVSPKLPASRTVWVYQPPTYVENTAFRAPVVYMHDGNNLFGLPGGFGDWLADDAMDEAAGTGAFREALLVGVGNTPDRIDEYTPTVDASVGGGGKADPYLALLVEDLKPKIDAQFRTLTGPPDTVLLGSSLGGLVSAYGGTKHATVFGCIGAMSPSTWWDQKVILGMVAASKGPAGRPLRVYVDSGDSGQSMDGVTDTNELAATYATLGYVEGKDLHHVVEKGGVHNEASWAGRLPGAFSFLLGPGR